MRQRHGHYKEVCKECDIIVSQCRCMSEKTIIKVTCDKCKAADFDIVPNIKQQLREALAREVYLRHQLAQLNEEIKGLEKNNER